MNGSIFALINLEKDLEIYRLRISTAEKENAIKKLKAENEKLKAENKLSKKDK